jgi:hypothetical protein
LPDDVRVGIFSLDITPPLMFLFCSCPPRPKPPPQPRNPIRFGPARPCPLLSAASSASSANLSTTAGNSPERFRAALPPPASPCSPYPSAPPISLSSSPASPTACAAPPHWKPCFAGALLAARTSRLRPSACPRHLGHAPHGSQQRPTPCPNPSGPTTPRIRVSRACPRKRKSPPPAGRRCHRRYLPRPRHHARPPRSGILGRTQPRHHRLWRQPHLLLPQAEPAAVRPRLRRARRPCRPRMARGTAAISGVRHRSALNPELSHAARLGTWVPGSALSASGCQVRLAAARGGARHRRCGLKQEETQKTRMDADERKRSVPSVTRQRPLAVTIGR